MILFLTDKTTTIADILECTGIKSNNFWFEYFMQIFKNDCERFDTFQSLVNCFDGNRVEIIRKLKMFDIDGNHFDEKIIYVLKQELNVDFVKIKSRRIKVIELSGLLNE